MTEPGAGNKDVVSFGPFSLDPRRRLLLKDGAPIVVGARTLDTLMALVARPNEPISKRELMAVVWPDVTVDEGSLRVQIAALRKALGDGKGGARYITTLAGRGYCFVAPISRVRDPAPEPAKTESTKPALALPDKPSIAVLAFQNMSGDPEQEYFADGMVEEIITALSRIRWLFVIARNSSFTYKGQAIDVKQVGRELGVRYVLEGSVRKATGRVRITAQLIEAETLAHLWAHPFDGSLEDVFDLQDQVATSVAGVIEPALQAAEGRRSAGRPMTDLTAYDLYLRALATFYPITRDRNLEALVLLRQAIAIDRQCGPALSLAAMCHMRLFREGWAEEPETTSREAVELARQALQVGENDPGILANAAFVLANFGEDIGAMMGLIDQALVLTPSFSRGWFLSGVVRLWAGQPDLAIEHAQTALRLSPRERMGTPLSLIGEAHFFRHEFDQAAARLLLSIQNHPGFPHSYRVLAACYAHMGRLDEARAIVARLRAITPQIVPSAAQLRNSADRELFLSGLRMAAGEER